MDGKHRHKVDQKLKPLKRKWKKSNLLWCYIFGSGTLVALDFLFLTLKRLFLPCAWNFSLVSKISLCSNGNISIAHHYFWFRLSSCPPTPKMASTPFFLGYSTQPLLRTLSPQRTEAEEEEEATIDCNSINQKRLLLQCIVLKSTLEKSFGCSF